MDMVLEVVLLMWIWLQANAMAVGEDGVYVKGNSILASKGS